MGYLDVKYEPMVLDDFVFACASTKPKIKELVNAGFGSPIIVLGQPGSGKLSVAKYIANALKSQLSADEVMIITESVGLSLEQWDYGCNGLLTNRITGECERLRWCQIKKCSQHKYTAKNYVPRYGGIINPINSTSNLSLVLIIHRGNFLTPTQVTDLSGIPKDINKWRIPYSRLLVIVTADRLKNLPYELVKISKQIYLEPPSAEQWLEKVKSIIKLEEFSAENDNQLLGMVRLCKGNGRHILYALESAMWD